jgi:bisphosphoglycerate-dependent phosphoglycerate mutase
MRKYTVSDAISSLRPGSKFEMLYGEYKFLRWHSYDMTVPTEQEVNAEVERLNSEEAKLQYKRERALEYPPLTEQLDMIYHHGVDFWKDRIKEIKDKYPKQ